MSASSKKGARKASAEPDAGEAAARNEAAALARIEALDDPKKLRGYLANARRLHAQDVWDAAFRRLSMLGAEGEPGTVENDFWRAIHALEEALTEERGKTTRLSRTRQKLAKVGVKQTVADLASSKTPSDGFQMLMERGMSDLTAEALVIRHEDEFPDDVVAAARARLDATEPGAADPAR